MYRSDGVDKLYCVLGFVELQDEEVGVVEFIMELELYQIELSKTFLAQVH